ncbi:MAG: hypothetical protein ACRBBU_08280 [Pseudooceanicola sp.]
MEALIWVGAIVSVFGLTGLIWSILVVNRARKSNLSDDDLRVAVQKALPLNLGALFLSVIGLMLVVLGIYFG